jgi:regulatory protein
MVDTDENPSSQTAIAYRKAVASCDAQERCTAEIKQKLIQWKVGRQDIQPIIKRLTDEGFLDDKRYAVSYVRGKFRINQWGKLKIKAGLYSKSIPEYVISKALESIDSEEYIKLCDELISKKLKQLGLPSRENLQKTAAFVISRGFEPNLVYSILKENQF